MLYDCRDFGGFLEVTLLWIHPNHQNLCRIQLACVGNNTYDTNNRSIYSVVLSFCVNNLFRGIPFSHDEKINEHIQASLLLGRRRKENLAWCFHSFCRFSRGAFWIKSLMAY